MIIGVEDDFGQWRDAIDDWTLRFRDRLPKLEDAVMRASLLKRALATILESIVLEHDLDDERRRRRGLHYRLIDELLRG